VVPVAEFEAARSQLTALAFRLLGSIDDAEDAVQSTWIKASAADADGLRNPAAWLTTVLTRVCLDQLRMRQRRREEPLLADMIPAEALAADEHYLRRENVSRALMVVLNMLTPSQRVAYVLHDLFGIPFGEVARTLGTSAGNAKKHASRARMRIEQTEPTPTTTSIDSAVVDAFLAAAAGGGIDRLLALMTDDCVRAADPALVPPGTPTIVTGASEVAEETALFADRIRASTAMLVDGRAAHVIAPGGHLLAVIDIITRDGRVARIDISRASAHTTFAITPTA
jgi:RNA polymerase sigma factor (sigma-70 family)